MYRQDRSFVVQVARAMSDPDQSPFVLLDAQRKGFEYCMDAIGRVLERTASTEKVVVVIEGPPGSGKSVLAAHLWATLARDPSVTGNIVLVTTSSAQRRNWERLFEHGGRSKAARGLVKPVNSFNPGLTPRWVMHAGPQAYHVIRASRVSIFLLDGDQSFRDNETTTRKRIEDLARKLGASRVEQLSLGASQFRCGGSVEYLEWLEALLGHAPSASPPRDWQRSRGGPFSFEIVADPGEFDRRLREHVGAGRSARLGASYSRPWKTQDDPDPHARRADEMDFCIRYRRDPLGEVGCPYVLRGFDFDYLGILWMSDYVRRDGQWVAQPEHVHESAWRKLMADVRKEPGSGPRTRELERRLARAYRILLSRAIHGVYVWFEDEETRDYVRSQLA